LKGKHGKDGVRLAVDLNKHCLGDAYPLRNIDDVIQQVGKANFVSTFDVKGTYCQMPVPPDHQWLTTFVWDRVSLPERHSVRKEADVLLYE